jgi:hypothetical protein
MKEGTAIDKLIKLIKTIPVMIYYFIAIKLGDKLGDLIFELQEYLMREPGYLVWAPTSFSRTFLGVTGLLIALGVFGLAHLLFLANLWIRNKEFPGVRFSLISTLGSAILLVFLLPTMPLTMDNYIAAGDRGFYHDSFFGFEPDLYPWKEMRVSLGYEYYSSRGDRDLGFNYIIQSGDKEYDLWKGLLNQDSHSNEQFRAVREIDEMARKHGVTFTIQRPIGLGELLFMMEDKDYTPEEISFVKKIFQMQ